MSQLAARLWTERRNELVTIGDFYEMQLNFPIPLFETPMLPSSRKLNQFQLNSEISDSNSISGSQRRDYEDPLTCVSQHRLKASVPFTGQMGGPSVDLQPCLRPPPPTPAFSDSRGETHLLLPLKQGAPSHGQGSQLGWM